MTAARRRRKSWRLAAPFLLALSGLWSGLFGGIPPLGAATTERIVANPHTGLAIDGYDPVAYFTDAAAKLGLSEFELRHAGVTWRFRNVGNRAAFVANPNVFMPRFGGYDPTAIARGASAPGHPELWIIAENRLYLFYSTAARDTFKAAPDSIIEEAERVWPTVRHTLTP